ncbi:MAG: sugar ABC transporter ATP-binding protein, partial [Oscillospiraceae bacterium]
DFSIEKGEIHGLIGENGAGKSTLMKVLMGIYKSEEGNIRFNDADVTITSPTSAISYGIGMVPQELNLNPYISAAENIYLGNEIVNGIKKINWKKTNEEATKILKTIGVNIDPHIIVNRLSVAQQQLVQIARVLATGADLLVFDEPTASLTASETEFLLSLMKRLKEQGKSIIFITHHLEELLSTTDRITVMRDGSVVFVSETEKVTLDILIEHMAGKKISRLQRCEREVSDEIILKVEDFSRAGEFENVSFEVKKGEIFGIGGLVGSGRTELANALFGLTKKDRGSLTLEGKRVEIKSPNRAISLGIGYVPEERRQYGIFPILSVMENIVISIYDSLFNGFMIQSKRSKEITQDYIKKINIRTPGVSTAIMNLSGGNQQKVILSRWLAKDVKLLILDEPTRGIDVNAKGEIYSLILKLTELGMTVIIISSEHEELLLLTDRVMIMHEGKVKGIKNTINLKQQDILEVALKQGGQANE